MVEGLRGRRPCGEDELLAGRREVAVGGYVEVETL